MLEDHRLPLLREHRAHPATAVSCFSHDGDATSGDVHRVGRGRAAQQFDSGGGHVHLPIRVVDDEQVARALAPAANRLDSSSLEAVDIHAMSPRLGFVALRRHSCGVADPVQQSLRRRRVKKRRDVVGNAGSDVAAGYCRRTGQRAIDVRRDNLCPDRRQQLRPDPAAPAVREGDGLVLQQRIELFNADAEQLAEGARVTAEPHGVVRVDDAAEEVAHELAARFDVAGEVRGRGCHSRGTGWESRRPCRQTSRRQGGRSRR